MLYGYSTGALAKGDFGAALSMLEEHDVNCVEVSALRMSEIDELLAALPTLPLGRYGENVTVHAPSKFEPSEEERLVRKLTEHAARVDGFVVHSEAIHDAALWRPLGSKVLVENADLRKRTGQTTELMLEVLAPLPEARVCFDIAHVYGVDTSMVEAQRMLGALGHRVAQIHISQLDHACRHHPLMHGVVRQFQRVAHLVPETSVVLESCVAPADIGDQLSLAKRCFER